MKLENKLLELLAGLATGASLWGSSAQKLTSPRTSNSKEEEPGLRSKAPGISSFIVEVVAQ